MQFTTSVLLAFAAATSVLAQFDPTAGFDAVTNPITPGSDIPANKPFTIKWDPSPAPNNGKISITLLQGTSNITLVPGPIIATGIDSQAGSFVWPVSDVTSHPFYGFKLSLDSKPTIFQYSTYFTISGLSASGGSSSGSSSSGSVSASTTVTSSVGTMTTATTSVASSSSASESKGASTTGGAAAQSSGPTFSNTTMSTSRPTGTATRSGTATSSGLVTQSSNAAVANVMEGSGFAAVVVVAFGLLL